MHLGWEGGKEETKWSQERKAYLTGDGGGNGRSILAVEEIGKGRGNETGWGRSGGRGKEEKGLKKNTWEGERKRKRVGR